MVHAFNTIVTVEWHDLMEDPNDLPKDYHEESRFTYVIMRNRKTGELSHFFSFDEWDQATYIPENNLWETTQEKYDKYGYPAGQETVGFKSYGLPCEDAEKKCDALSDFEVVAWSYGPDAYSPGYNPLTKSKLEQ